MKTFQELCGWARWTSARVSRSALDVIATLARRQAPGRQHQWRGKDRQVATPHFRDVPNRSHRVGGVGLRGMATGPAPGGEGLGESKNRMRDAGG
jgi:hypothetical protein